MYHPVLTAIHTSNLGLSHKILGLQGEGDDIIRTCSVTSFEPGDIVNFLQHNTMQMMYEVIYKALEEAGLENTCEPQDYLNFFCLGNREAEDLEGTSDAGNSTATNTPQVYISYLSH